MDLKPFTHYLSGVYSSEKLACYKPNPQFYEKIIKDAQLVPEECLFVGDSIIDDVIGPKSSGMNTLLLNRKGNSQRKYPEIHSLDEIETDLQNTKNE